MMPELVSYLFYLFLTWQFLCFSVYWSEVWTTKATFEWVAHIAGDLYSIGVANFEASIKDLEAEIARLQAESILANDQVWRLTSEVGELDVRLQNKEIVDKAEEKIRYAKESALGSVEAHIKDIEDSFAHSEDHL